MIKSYCRSRNNSLRIIWTIKVNRSHCHPVGGGLVSSIVVVPYDEFDQVVEDVGANALSVIISNKIDCSKYSNNSIWSKYWSGSAK